MLELFSQYGYWSVFAVVLLVQLGAPLPVLPLFLLVGSFALHDPLLGLLSLLAAVPLHQREQQGLTRLSISSPPTFARQVLVPALPGFAARKAGATLR